jgi:hypothetical protein
VRRRSGRNRSISLRSGTRRAAHRAQKPPAFRELPAPHATHAPSESARVRGAPNSAFVYASLIYNQSTRTAALRSIAIPRPDVIHTGNRRVLGLCLTQNIPRWGGEICQPSVGKHDAVSRRFGPVDCRQTSRRRTARCHALLGGAPIGRTAIVRHATYSRATRCSQRGNVVQRRTTASLHREDDCAEFQRSRLTHLGEKRQLLGRVFDINRNSFAGGICAVRTCLTLRWSSAADTVLSELHQRTRRLALPVC